VSKTADVGRLHQSLTRKEEAITVREPDRPMELTARFADTATHPPAKLPDQGSPDAIQTNFENSLA
jgi:hypothetical protein